MIYSRSFVCNPYQCNLRMGCLQRIFGILAIFLFQLSSLVESTFDADKLTTFLEDGKSYINFFDLVLIQFYVLLGFHEKTIKALKDSIMKVIMHK